MRILRALLLNKGRFLWQVIGAILTQKNTKKELKKALFTLINNEK